MLAGLGTGKDDRDGSSSSAFDKRPVAYVVAVIGAGKRKFRRLHKGSLPCGKILGVSIHNWETHPEDKRVRYDDFCHKCWPAGELPGLDLGEKKRRCAPPVVDDEEDDVASSHIPSSSSSDSSSSDDTDSGTLRKKRPRRGAEVVVA